MMPKNNKVHTLKKGNESDKVKLHAHTHTMKKTVQSFKKSSIYCKRSYAQRLNSTEHELSTAHKNMILEKIFYMLKTLRCYIYPAY